MASTMNRSSSYYNRFWRDLPHVQLPAARREAEARHEAPHEMLSREQQFVSPRALMGALRAAVLESSRSSGAMRSRTSCTTDPRLSRRGQTVFHHTQVNSGLATIRTPDSA
jgi:hypothetical protein